MTLREGKQDNCQSAGRTRDRLLDVAERLFADRGFESTPIREITRQAKCNLSAVNYHFHGKDNLYQEVFRRRLGALREQRLASIRRGRGAHQRPASIESLLRSFAAAFIEPLLDKDGGERVTQLMLREVVNPRLPSDLFLDEMVRPIQHELHQALTTVCPGLDRKAAMLCVQSIVGQLLQIALARRLVREGEHQAAVMSDMGPLLEHFVRFSAGGLRACAATT